MKHTDDEATESQRKQIATDGQGPVSKRESATESPFTTVSSTSITKRDRYKWILRQWVYAPTMIIWSDWRARIGALIILGYVAMGTAGIYIVESPSPNQGPVLAYPSQTWNYPLGTDNLGRGLHNQIVHATPAMLKMILAGAVFSTIMATLIGTYSGYKGGRIDRLLMTFTDVIMTIPGLPLIIVLAVVFEPRSPWLVGLILTINAWGGLARAIRSQVLTLRDESFVEASRIIGMSTRTILQKDILPGLMPYITVNFVNSARAVIFASVGLYFLGILPFSYFNWGVMMNVAYRTGGSLYTLETAHWLFVPMMTVIILSFGLILFAQGTDRLFNPRVIARHTSPTEVQEESDSIETDDVSTRIQ